MIQATKVKKSIWPGLERETLQPLDMRLDVRGHSGLLLTMVLLDTDSG